MKFIKNEQFNSLEIQFDEKPSQAVKELKKYDYQLNNTREMLKNYSIRLEEINADIKNFQDSYKTDADAFNANLKNGVYSSLSDKKSAINADIKLLKRVKQLQLCNYELALYAALKPAIIEILKKYNNKALGTKTNDNLRSELNNAVGAYKARLDNNHVVIYSAWGCQSHHIHDLTIAGLFELKNNKIVLSDSTPVLMYHNNEYFKNYNAIIKRQDTLINDLKELDAKMRKLCDEYNNLGDHWNRAQSASNTLYGIY